MIVIHCIRQKTEANNSLRKAQHRKINCTYKIQGKFNLLISITFQHQILTYLTNNHLKDMILFWPSYEHNIMMNPTWTCMHFQVPRQNYIPKLKTTSKVSSLLEFPEGAKRLCLWHVYSDLNLHSRPWSPSRFSDSFCLERLWKTHGTNFTAPMLVSPLKDSYFWSSIGKKIDFWIMSQQLPSKLHKINEFFKFLHILERIKKSVQISLRLTISIQKKLLDIIYFSAF